MAIEKDWKRIEKGIYKRKNSDRLWIAVSCGGKLHRESVGSSSIKKARELRDVRAGQARTDALPETKARRTMVGELADDLVADYETYGRKSTKRLINSITNLLRTDKNENPLDDASFSGLHARDITTARIKKYVAARLTDCPVPKNATINRELSALRRMLNLGKESGKVAKVPTFPKQLPESVREGFINDEVFRALRAALPHYLRPLVTVLFETGMRKGEALGLCWEGFDEEGITGWVDMRDGLIKLRAAATKNGYGRVIPLNDEIERFLRELKNERDLTDPHFPWTFHRIVKSELRRIGSFRKTWIAANKRILKKPILVHDLRRSAIRNLIRAGIPERVAMEISGHKTRSVFDRYHIVSEDDLRRAMKDRDNARERDTSHLLHSSRDFEEFERDNFTLSV